MSIAPNPIVETNDEIQKPVGIVKLKIREVYGKTMMYPDNDNAKLFCKIAKTETMTKVVLGYTKQLGYAIITDRTGFEP